MRLRPCSAVAVATAMALSALGAAPAEAQEEGSVQVRVDPDKRVLGVFDELPILGAPFGLKGKMWRAPSQGPFFIRILLPAPHQLEAGPGCFKVNIVLVGCDPPDRLDGGGGRDVLNGGHGNDVIDARDGRRDLVRCGPGIDLALVDPRDVVRGCEIVR